MPVCLVQCREMGFLVVQGGPLHCSNVTLLAGVWVQLQQQLGSIKCSGLEGTFKITKFQTPCHKQDHLPLEQVAQCPISLALQACIVWFLVG